MKRRRTFLTTFGGFALASIAGCTTNTPSQDGGAVPDVEIVDHVSPMPEVVEEPTVNETSDGSEEYRVTVGNSGEEGSILVQLYWYPEESGNEGDTNIQTEHVESDIVELSAGAEEEVIFNHEMPEEYANYQVYTAPQEFEIHVENDGGKGLVEAILYRGNLSDQVRSTTFTVGKGDDAVETINVPSDATLNSKKGELGVAIQATT